MKNNKFKKFILLSTAVLLLLIVLLYLGIPSFSISVNRTLEMMKSGSEKGLMMIFYQFRPYEYIFAGFTVAIQKLTIVFPIKPVIKACNEYFKGNVGAVVLFAGSIISLGVGYSLGYGVRFLVKKVMKIGFNPNKVSQVRGIFENLVLLIAFAIGAANFYWVGVMFYITGFLEVDIRKLCLVFSLAILIANWSI